MDILHKEGNAKTGTAIHGFSEDHTYAKRCIDMGIYLSIGIRPIAAPENEALLNTIRHTPLEWLLTETDTADPTGALTVAEKVAELKGTSTSEIGQATTQNLRKLIETPKPNSKEKHPRTRLPAQTYHPKGPRASNISQTPPPPSPREPERPSCGQEANRKENTKPKKQTTQTQ